MPPTQITTFVPVFVSVLLVNAYIPRLSKVRRVNGGRTSGIVIAPKQAGAGRNEKIP